jgi:hypothetical protein
LLTAFASRGFRSTRALIHLAQSSYGHSVHRGDPFGVVLSYAIPIAFALVVGIAMVLSRGAVFHRVGWRYWSFFVGKTTLILAGLPVLWIELTPLIRAVRPNSEGWLILAGVLWRLTFIVGFGCALGWSFADQRRRCPVCLRRLSSPVTFGSWSSMFEPVTVEFLCEDGHGSLSLPESELAPEDRWVKLDESWHELFEVKK